jgi:hypothetical protein
MAAVIPLQTSKCLKSRGGRRKNRELRSREHLTPDEVERMIAAVRQRGRYGLRDGLLIMLTFRHGLRASELIALRWDQMTISRSCISAIMQSSSPATLSAPVAAALTTVNSTDLATTTSLVGWKVVPLETAVRQPNWCQKTFDWIQSVYRCGPTWLM